MQRFLIFRVYISERANFQKLSMLRGKNGGTEMHIKEKRLVRELKSSSTKALGEVIDNYSGYTAAVIRNFSRGMLTEEDIDELCSDVFFSLWEHRASLDGVVGLRAYIAASARNAVKNRFRKMNPPADSIDELEIADEYSVEDAALLNDMTRCLGEALDTLNKKQREIFMRYYFYGEKSSEIADFFKITESSVRCELTRTRKLLKNYLTKRGFDHV